MIRPSPQLAITSRTPGRISSDDLVGMPDLLRREEDGYVAGDIKSGTAGEPGKPGRVSDSGVDLDRVVGEFAVEPSENVHS